MSYLHFSNDMMNCSFCYSLWMWIEEMCECRRFFPHSCCPIWICESQSGKSNWSWGSQQAYWNGAAVTCEEDFNFGFLLNIDICNDLAEQNIDSGIINFGWFKMKKKKNRYLNAKIKDYQFAKKMCMKMV